MDVGCTVVAGYTTAMITRQTATSGHGVDVTGGYTTVVWAIGRETAVSGLLTKHSVAGLMSVNFVTGEF